MEERKCFNCIFLCENSNEKVWCSIKNREIKTDRDYKQAESCLHFNSPKS